MTDIGQEALNVRSMYEGYDIEVPKPRNPLLIKSRITNLRLLIFMNGIYLLYQALFFRSSELTEFNDTLAVYQSIAILFALLSFYIAFLYDHLIQGITDLFGIYINETEYIDLPLREGKGSNLLPKLESLWETKVEFDKFQMMSYKKITHVNLDYYALITATILVAIRLYLDRFIIETIFDADITHIIFTFGYLILSKIYLFWLLTGWFSGLFILLQLVLILASIRNENGVVIKHIWHVMNIKLQTNSEDQSIREILSINPEDRLMKSAGFASKTIQNENLGRYSLTRFRRKCNAIPSFLLPINIGIFIINVLTLGIFIIFNQVDEVGKFETLSIYASLVSISLFLIGLFVFIYPQVSIWLLIREEKLRILDRLEEIYQVKEFEWLSLDGTHELERKKFLIDEINLLSTIISKNGSISSLPSNYRQILTIFGSSVGMLLLLGQFAVAL